VEVFGVLFFLTIGHAILSDPKLHHAHRFFSQLYRTAVSYLKTSSKIVGKVKPEQQDETAGPVLQRQDGSWVDGQTHAKPDSEVANATGPLCISIPRAPSPLHFVEGNCDQEQVRMWLVSRFS
jgi:hypothetical protein